MQIIMQKNAKKAKKCLIWICTPLQEICALPFHSGYTSVRVVCINWQLC